MSRICLALAVFVAAGALKGLAQSAAAPSDQAVLQAGVTNAKMETTDDWNRRLQSLVHSALNTSQGSPSPGDYRIGPDDQLQVTVFDAPEDRKSVV